MRKYEYLSLRIEKPDPFSNVNLMITPPGFELEEHQHSFYHVNKILEGSVYIEFKGKTYKLGAGCTFVLPPNQAHSLRSDSGYVQIGIDVECVDDSRGIRSELEEICGGFAFKKIPISVYDADEHSKKMRKLLSAPTKGNCMRAINIAECQILDFLDAFRRENSDGFVMQFTAMLSRYTPWQLKLSDMSRILYLSRSELEKKAKYAFGCGASEYCARVRYSRVCELLESDMPLQMIAEQCGFCDCAHLSKFFSSRAGMSPGKYRRIIKQ